MSNTSVRPKKREFCLYLLPGLCIYVFTALAPIVMAAYYSFFAWKGGPKKIFIGLENYTRLLSDEVFWKAFGNNMYMLLLSLIGQVGIGLCFALLLNSKIIRFKKLHRTLCYFPSTLAPVVVAFIWTIMYNYNFGLINATLRGIGLDNLAMPWLDLAKPIMTLVTIPLIWQNIGYYMILMMAGFSAISPEVLEMAEIDGATGVKKALHITLPLMKNTIMVCVMLCITGNMRGFENVYIMTDGGPGNASNLVALYAYETSFKKFNYGYGSAVSIGIVIISLLIVLASRVVIQRKER